MVLVYFLVCLVVVLGLSAACAVLTVTNQRITSESTTRMRTFYLADSGVHLGNFMVRASGGTLPATTVNETIDGEVVTIEIDPVSPDLYEITSTGTVLGDSTTIVMHVEFTSTLAMEGAVQVNVDEGVEVSTSELVFDLNASTEISGLDHSATGALLADQSEATYGVALAPIPGGTDVDVSVEVSGGAEITGSPETTSNDVTGQSEVFSALLLEAQTNADITVLGGTTLANPATGSYGTSADPVLVYVQLGDNETLHMRQNFTGYGTLVIEASNTTTDPALYLENSVEWFGLVVVNFTGDAEIPGEALVRMDNHATIIGGLSINLSGPGSTFTGAGEIFEANTGNAGVLYSSELVSSSSGVSAVVTSSARVLSYMPVVP